MRFIKDFFNRHINAKLVPVKLGFNTVSKDVLTLQDHVYYLHNNTKDWHDYLNNRNYNLDKDIKITDIYPFKRPFKRQPTFRREKQKRNL